MKSARITSAKKRKNTEKSKIRKFKCKKQLLQQVGITTSHLTQNTQRYNDAAQHKKAEMSLEELEDSIISERLTDISMQEEKLPNANSQRVSKKQVIKALQNLRREKNLLHDNYCNKFAGSNHSWNSAAYIIRHIRSCLMTHKWTHLTQLLLLLMNHSQRYFAYIKEIALLNLLVNVADYNGELLEQFLQKCFIQVDSIYKEDTFDICYTTTK